MSNHNRKSLVREDQENVVVGEKSWDALWAASNPSALRYDHELAADGWKPTDEIARMWNVSAQTVLKRMRSMGESCQFDRCEGKIGTQGVRGWFYRPKAPGVTRLVR